MPAALRLLAELPCDDPRLLARGEGWATLQVGGRPLTLSVAARSLPGLATPAGDAAAAAGALGRLGEPLALLQIHRLGEAEAPGMEGRVRALKASALAVLLPAMDGVVSVGPEWDALLQSHAFALGLQGSSGRAELPEGEVLPEGRPPEMAPRRRETLSPMGAEAQARRRLGDPACGDPSPLCGPGGPGRALLLEGSPALAFAASDASNRGDPFWDAAEVAASAARKVACVGAEPQALVATLCLGSGEHQDWALQQVLGGLRQAALALDLPILALGIAAPVPGFAPLLRPAVAALGTLEDHAGPVDPDAPEATGLRAPGHRSCGQGWRRAGDGLFLLGTGGELRLDEELALQRVLREGINLGLLRSARDLGPGGLLSAAADGCRAGGLGAHLLLPLREDPLTQTPGRALVSLSPDGESALRTLCATHRLPHAKIGAVGGGRLAVARDGEALFDLGLDELEGLYRSGLAGYGI